MLDFSREKFHKYRLSEVPFSEFEAGVAVWLLEGENVLAAFKAGRDGVVFTTNRLITIDNHSSRQTDYTSIPYTSIDVFSVDTAGAGDRETELDILIKGVGKFGFEFDKATSIGAICKYISVCKFR